jgi:hypothetical protein
MGIRPLQLLDSFHRQMTGLFGAGDELADNRKNIVLGNYAASTTANLVAGNFLTGLLLLMNADDAFMGLVTMATLFGNLLHVLSPLLLERFEKRKTLLIWGRVLVYTLNLLFIGAIPYLPYENKIKLAATLAVILLTNLLSAILGAGYAVWHIRSIPEKIRTNYFTFFNVTNGVLVYSAILGFSKLVDHFKAAGNEMAGLTVVRGIALILGLVDLFFLTRIREYENAKSSESLHFMAVLVNPFKNREYRKTVMTACLWCFSASIPGPYFTVYMLKDLKVEYSYLSIVGMLQLLTLVFVTPLWARRFSSPSGIEILRLGMLMIVFHYAGLVFVTRETLFLYPVIAFISYIATAGIGLVMSKLPYVNIPEGNQTNYIGFYNTMAYLAMLLGVGLGNLFIKLSEGKTLLLFGFSLQNKQYILLLAAALMLASVVATGVIGKNGKSVDSSIKGEFL